MAFNPIARRPDYRREVLFYLGESIELDGQRWSDAELSSMKNRRMLLVLHGEEQRAAAESSIWGQSVEVQMYPKARVQTGNVMKSPKLVLGYPSLPRSQTMPAHFVEIQNPPSTLPMNSKHGGRSLEIKENGDNSSPGSQGIRLPVRSVGEYFRTQRDVIVTKEKNEKKEIEDQVTTTGMLDVSLARCILSHNSLINACSMCR
ncbi:unnamed protein product [Phytophthora fragariaefolia]|uniref:Unnamed protein product n=1 Tax=Phytophthora fragariaefolia TaxID=1490495 RepID=A0A9W6Y5S7_9STRA|nr:unnamed protein product [Phytophthora fragariaefolia]